MKFTVVLVATMASAITCEWAMAQTKAERCAAYAHNAGASTPTTTGVARGAVRGAVVGSFGANAGRGAAVGAVVGGTRRAVQKNRSYQYYYDQCMAR
jgi:hypothetical protein